MQRGEDQEVTTRLLGDYTNNNNKNNNNNMTTQPPPPHPQPFDTSRLDRQVTFTQSSVDHQHLYRKTSINRAFTFEGGPLEAPISTITRTITAVGQTFDPDGKFTKAVIQDYSTAAESGNEGDIPFPPGFALGKPFWGVMILTIVVAGFMGFAAAGFMNFTEEIPKQWDDCDYDNDSSCGDWYTGEKWWILMSGGGGFVIGMIRYFFSYPDNLPGLFKDVQLCHVEPKWIILTYTISALSLAIGANLGPEQALGNLGGGIATLITEYIDFEDIEYDHLFALAGMAAPLGALFPSPLLGALMMHELGEPPKSFMESTVILSIAATFCFATYYGIIGITYVDHASTNQIILLYDWVKLQGGYYDWQLGTGVVIGIVAAALCFGVLLTIGIVKQIFFRIRTRLAFNKFLQHVVPPTIGGICIGTVNWALPATVGNGSLVLTFLVKYGTQKKLSRRLLLCTGFARMFLLAVSMNCGFVGGIIYPFLTMGVIAGTIMYQCYDYVPRGLCIAAFMVALPCGIVPLPFSFACISIFVFFLGGNLTVPIFISCIISYWLISGTGLLNALVARANKNKANSVQEVRKEADQERKRTLQGFNPEVKDENYVVQQYLGKSKNTIVTNPMASPVANNNP